MPEEFDPRTEIEEILARHEFDLSRSKDALGLLAVSPCSCCKKFFRRTDAGVLFDAGELICYGCVHCWWTERCGQLSVKDRLDLEGKLVYWLRATHQPNCSRIRRSSQRAHNRN